MHLVEPRLEETHLAFELAYFASDQAFIERAETFAGAKAGGRGGTRSAAKHYPRREVRPFCSIQHHDQVRGRSGQPATYMIPPILHPRLTCHALCSFEFRCGSRQGKTVGSWPRLQDDSRATMPSGHSTGPDHSDRRRRKPRRNQCFRIPDL